MSARKTITIAFIVGTVSALSACSGGSASNSGSSNTSANITNANAGKPQSNSASNAAVNASTSAGTAFSRSLELHGIKFTVESPNSASGNTVTIKPSGLEIANDEIKKNIEGSVYGADIGDLDIDGSPEVYVYVRDLSAAKRSSLVAYSANKKKSLSEIAIPEIDPKSKEFTGYNGEDEFAVVESSLARRFPIFEGTGASAKKTGKMRQLQYKLKQGEATWQLTVDKTTEF